MPHESPTPSPGQPEQTGPADRQHPQSTPARPVRSVKMALAAAVAVAALGGLAFKGWQETVERPRRLAEQARLQDMQSFGIEASDAVAPDFRLVTMDGGAFALGEHRGELLFVNFWATWCPPCRDELPSMVRLGQELTARYPGRFRMVAVSVDESWDVVRQFFGGRTIPGLTVTLDTDQLTTRAYYCVARGQCPESYKFPETYIVDAKGRLVAYVVGPRDWGDPAARRFLERLLGG